MIFQSSWKRFWCILNIWRASASAQSAFQLSSSRGYTLKWWKERTLKQLSMKAFLCNDPAFTRPCIARMLWRFETRYRFYFLGCSTEFHENGSSTHTLLFGGHEAINEMGGIAIATVLFNFTHFPWWKALYFFASYRCGTPHCFSVLLTDYGFSQPALLLCYYSDS